MTQWPLLTFGRFDISLWEPCLSILHIQAVFLIRMLGFSLLQLSSVRNKVWRQKSWGETNTAWNKNKNYCNLQKNRQSHGLNNLHSWNHKSTWVWKDLTLWPHHRQGCLPIRSGSSVSCPSWPWTLERMGHPQNGTFTEVFSFCQDISDLPLTRVHMCLCIYRHAQIDIFLYTCMWIYMCLSKTLFSDRVTFLYL